VGDRIRIWRYISGTFRYVGAEAFNAAAFSHTSLVRDRLRGLALTARIRSPA
jgi:hypothetical protein